MLRRFREIGAENAGAPLAKRLRLPTPMAFVLQLRDYPSERAIKLPLRLDWRVLNAVREKGLRFLRRRILLSHQLQK